MSSEVPPTVLRKTPTNTTVAAPIRSIQQLLQRSGVDPEAMKIGTVEKAGVLTKVQNQVPVRLQGIRVDHDRPRVEDPDHRTSVDHDLEGDAANQVIVTRIIGDLSIPVTSRMFLRIWTMKCTL